MGPDEWLWRLDCIQEEMARTPVLADLHVLIALKIDSHVSSSEEWKTFPFGIPVLVAGSAAGRYVDPETGALWFDLGARGVACVVCWDDEAGLSLQGFMPTRDCPVQDGYVLQDTLGWYAWDYLERQTGRPRSRSHAGLLSRICDLEEGILDACHIAPAPVKESLGLLSLLGSWPLVLFYLALNRVHPLLGASGCSVPSHPPEHDERGSTFAELNDRVIMISPDFASAARYAFDVMRRVVGAQASAGRQRHIPVQLNWRRISAEEFERLVFCLISTTEGYENPQWLTRTCAPDRGRDLSVMRVQKDPLSGTRRSRVVISCKHWLSRSLSRHDVSAARDDMSLLGQPRVETLILATSGRFTSDAVALAEQHNQSGSALQIDMWPESHLEWLLADRLDLVREVGLRRRRRGSAVRS